MAKLKLSRLSPSEHLFCESQDEAIKLTMVLQKKLYDLLYLMFADGK